MASLPSKHAFAQCTFAGPGVKTWPPYMQETVSFVFKEDWRYFVTIGMLILQAQAKADKDAEAAKAAIQAAQEQATSNQARAVEAEEKLAAEVAAHSDADAKFVELEVCSATCFDSACLSCVNTV